MCSLADLLHDVVDHLHDAGPWAVLTDPGIAVLDLTTRRTSMGKIDQDLFKRFDELHKGLPAFCLS